METRSQSARPLADHPTTSSSFLNPYFYFSLGLTSHHKHHPSFLPPPLSLLLPPLTSFTMDRSLDEIIAEDSSVSIQTTPCAPIGARPVELTPFSPPDSANRPVPLAVDAIHLKIAGRAITVALER
jgi:hypothetical protein